MEVLNITPEYGLSVTYEFKNDVHETLMGKDYCNARWLHPIAKYNFSVAYFNQSVYDYLLDFFLFVEGGEDDFLFEDPCNNYCPRSVDLNGITVSGVLIDRGDGSFQMCKQWQVGSFYYRKPVIKPKEGIVIYQPDLITPVNATIDYNNGVVTGVNESMRWEGEFYTVVRFENDSIPKEILSYNDSTGEQLYSIPDLRLVEVKQYPTDLNSNLNSNYTHIYGLSYPIGSTVTLLGKTDIVASDSGYDARDALDTYRREINFGYSKINFYEQQYLLGLWHLTLGGWGTFQLADIELDFAHNVKFTEPISFSPLVKPISTNVVTFGWEDVLFKADNITLKEELPNAIKTTFCQIWTVTREDGVRQGFTNHDRNFNYNGNPYPAVFGFSGTPSQRTAELNTDSTELTGVFGSDDYTDPQFFSLFILEEDLITGKYDNASVVVELFDWLNKSVFSTQFRGSIGGYTTGYLADKAKQYEIEVLSIAEKLDVNVTAETSSECRHRFLSQGYGRCNLTPTPNNTTNANLPQIKATYGGAESLSRIILTSPATNNWEGFRYGTVRFLTGKLTGTEVYIADTFMPSMVQLLYPLPIAPSNGDEVLITRPCNKTVEACKNFNNIANYGGFPRLPGIDNLVSGAET